jgi:phosphotransferase system IIB component
VKVRDAGVIDRRELATAGTAATMQVSNSVVHLIFGADAPLYATAMRTALATSQHGSSP